MLLKKPPSFRIVFFAVGVFVLLEGIVTLMGWRSYENKKAFILDRNIKIFDDVYNSTRQGYSKIAKLLYDQVINTPEVIAVCKEANNPDPRKQAEARQRLYELLLPAYQSLGTINIGQLHFQLPDSSSFMRFHRPERYGDSLVGIRYSIEKANREKTYVEGFEEGRIFNGFRYVYPLFDAQKHHLGSVETSLSFRGLSEDIARTTGYDVDYVVKKAIVERKVWKEEQDNYYPSALSDAYCHEREDPDASVRRDRCRPVAHAVAEEASKKMKEDRPFALYRQGYIISFIPIPNVKGEKGAAYLIGYNKTNAIAQIHDAALMVWGLSTLAVFVIVALGVLLVQKILQINNMATRDALTGLLNRHSLSERIGMEIARFKRTEEAFSLIYLDVDDFKKINDRYGHESGDRALRTLAALLGENTRDIDSVGRWGGEEFLICLPNTGTAQVNVVAEKLREKVAAAEFGLPVNVTASFGIATYRSGEELNHTVARADAGLYRAKTQGKNRVCSAS